MIKRILHATDFSGSSRPALKLARELAAAFRAELILFYAYQPVSRMMGAEYLPNKLLEETQSRERDSARRKLERMALAVRRPRLRVSTLVGEGPAAEAIVLATRKKRANLLVLGTAGRSGVSRVLIGSVAEQVVRTANCPVLTVRAGKS